MNPNAPLNLIKALMHADIVDGYANVPENLHTAAVKAMKALVEENAKLKGQILRFGPVGCKIDLVMDGKVIGESKIHWPATDIPIHRTYPPGEPQESLWGPTLNVDELNAHGFGAQVSEEESKP